MRGFLKELEGPAVWVLFFFTSVYGHVALKAAVPKAAAEGYVEVLAATAGSFWGWSAAVAWGLSCALWTLALSQHSLTSANAIASLRYVLVWLAAWSVLGEPITWPQGVGVVCITGGIFLVE
jgi:uncharacterized membrane protein